MEIVIDECLWLLLVSHVLFVFVLAGFVLLGKFVKQKKLKRVVIFGSFSLVFFSTLLLGCWLDTKTPMEIQLNQLWGCFFLPANWRFLLDFQNMAIFYIGSLLAAVVAYFSSHYLWGEDGYLRYFFFYGVFVFGFLLASLSEELHLFALGWELVGLASFFLISFYINRLDPPRNALAAGLTYKLSDSFLMVATVFLGHEFSFESANHSFDLRVTMGGLALVFAAMAKGSLIPFHMWIFRSMEGPTPSSAIFYGGLSIHLGPILILKFFPDIVTNPFLSTSMIIFGSSSFLYGLVMSRTRADIKTQLAFGVISQLGLIFAEIGFGVDLRFVLAHILGHLCLRTYQMLKVPSAMDDFKKLGLRRHHQVWSVEKLILPSWLRVRLYKGSLVHFYQDLWIEKMQRFFASWGGSFFTGKKLGIFLASLVFLTNLYTVVLAENYFWGGLLLFQQAMGIFCFYLIYIFLRSILGEPSRKWLGIVGKMPEVVCYIVIFLLMALGAPPFSTFFLQHYLYHEIGQNHIWEFLIVLVLDYLCYWACLSIIYPRIMGPSEYNLPAIQLNSRLRIILNSTIIFSFILLFYFKVFK